MQTIMTKRCRILKINHRPFQQHGNYIPNVKENFAVQLLLLLLKVHKSWLLHLTRALGRISRSFYWRQTQPYPHSHRHLLHILYILTLRYNICIYPYVGLCNLILASGKFVLGSEVQYVHRTNAKDGWFHRI